MTRLRQRQGRPHRVLAKVRGRPRGIKMAIFRTQTRKGTRPSGQSRSERCAEKGVMSNAGVRPMSRSPIACPVIGPFDSPIWPWPKAKNRPRWRGASPITGSPSGVEGRAPSQGSFSTGAPSASGAARLAHRGVDLGGVGRRAQRGELDARGDAHALAHRREHMVAAGCRGWGGCSGGPSPGARCR